MEVENKRITLDAFRTMPDIVDPMPVAHLLGISDRSVYSSARTERSKP